MGRREGNYVVRSTLLRSSRAPDKGFGRLRLGRAFFVGIDPRRTGQLAQCGFFLSTLEKCRDRMSANTKSPQRRRDAG